MKKEVLTNKVIEEQKNNKFCNLDDPKLIDAYNEGYYGFNNVPKQYYIFPPQFEIVHFHAVHY